MSRRDARPRLVVLGPTPPPHHGMTTFTRMLLDSTVLGSAYDVLHVDTSDRRGLDNMGRLDIGNVSLALAHAWRLTRVLAWERPDVVLVQVSQNSWAYVRDALFIALARASGARVVTHLNGGGFRDFYEHAPGPVRSMVRATSRWVDGAAVLGARLLPSYDGLIPERRRHVLPNGVDDPWPDSEGHETEGPVGEAHADTASGSGGEVVVAYLGMLVESKGYLDLIEAARLLAGSTPRIRLRLAGPWWSDAEERRGRERARGLDAVEFAGIVAGDEKWRLLREADLVALPTYYPPEGQPQVILEAMAASRPVIATDRGAIADAVKDGETGLLVKERDPAALAEALRRLALDPVRRRAMGRAGRRRFEAEFTSKRCADRLVAILDRVRANGASHD